jgi:phage terminase Nu1 subunit (DNA packaging protein)
MPNPRGRNKKDQDTRLTIGEAAAICGVTYKTFASWRTSPFPPPETDEKDHKISGIALGEYIRERVHREYAKQRGEDLNGRLDGAQEKARLSKLQADKVEMELAVRSKELIEIGQVKTAAFDMIMRCRARLLRLPSAITPLLIGQTDRVSVQNTIDTGVRDALNELSVAWEDTSDDADGE